MPVESISSHKQPFPARPGAHHCCLRCPARPSRDGLDPIFVVDTGANGVIFGSTLAGSAHLTEFQETPGRHVNSNSHRDRVLGSAVLSGVFICTGGSPVPVSLRGLVVPSSKWNILPPVFVPRYEGADIDKLGVISMSVAGGRVLRTLPYQGLQVVRISLCAADTLVTNAVQRSPTASAALLIRPQAPSALVRLHQTLAHCGCQPSIAFYGLV